MSPSHHEMPYLLRTHLMSVMEVRFEVSEDREPLVAGGTRVAPHLEVNDLNVRSESFLEIVAVRALAWSFGEGVGVDLVWN